MSRAVIENGVDYTYASYTNQYGVKLIDQIYQNSSRTRVVTCTLQVNTAVAGDQAVGAIRYAPLSANVDNPTSTKQLSGVFIPSAVPFSGYMQLIGVIPPNYFYMIKNLSLVGGSIQITTWDEIDMG